MVHVLLAVLQIRNCDGLPSRGAGRTFLYGCSADHALGACGLECCIG